MSLRNILDLPEDNLTFGNKIRNLSSLSKNGICVPKGYAIPTKDYFDFLNPIKSEIDNIVSKKEFNESSKLVRELFLSQNIGGIGEEIQKAILEFGGKCSFAVRSSGFCYSNRELITEDSERSALAGQYESFLNVSGNYIGDAVKLCWASLFNERSLRSFNANKDRDYLNSGMSVIVQQMILGDKSAVLMTKDPLEERDVFGIESTYGPCEAIVSGKVTGDLTLCDRKSRKIVEQEKGSKSHRVSYLEFRGNNQENYELIGNSKEMQDSYALSEDEVKRLFDLGLKIESIFGRPQDIESTILNEKIYILQARSITTIENGK